MGSVGAIVLLVTSVVGLAAPASAEQTLRFDVNGGTCTPAPSAITAYQQEQVTLPSVAGCTKPGFTPAGWANTCTGALLPSAVTLVEGTTLCLVWTAVPTPTPTPTATPSPPPTITATCSPRQSRRGTFICRISTSGIPAGTTMRASTIDAFQDTKQLSATAKVPGQGALTWKLIVSSLARTLFFQSSANGVTITSNRVDVTQS